MISIPESLAQFIHGATMFANLLVALYFLRFWYESRDGRFPLHRTSSMVSELAPIVLYLRHLLDPGHRRR